MLPILCMYFVSGQDVTMSKSSSKTMFNVIQGFLYSIDIIITPLNDKMHVARIVYLFYVSCFNHLFSIYIHTLGNTVVQDKVLHPRVTCDGCSGPVYGTRYKCTVCPNYDLCERCKSMKRHLMHPMTAIRSPQGTCA